MADDLDLNGCDYVNKVDATRFPAESTYAPVESLKEQLRAPFKTAFNLTAEQSQNMTFMNAFRYSDVVQSREFEGLELGYEYT